MSAETEIDQEVLSRRDFLKATGVAGVGVFIPEALSARERDVRYPNLIDAEWIGVGLSSEELSKLSLSEMRALSPELDSAYEDAIYLASLVAQGKIKESTDDVPIPPDRLRIDVYGSYVNDVARYTLLVKDTEEKTTWMYNPLHPDKSVVSRFKYSHDTGELTIGYRVEHVGSVPIVTHEPIFIATDGTVNGYLAIENNSLVLVPSDERSEELAMTPTQTPDVEGVIASVDSVSPFPDREVEVSVKSLNVREAPVNGRPYGALQEGINRVPVIGFEEENWIPVWFGDRPGYISGDFATVLPVPEPPTSPVETEVAPLEQGSYVQADYDIAIAKLPPELVARVNLPENNQNRIVFSQNRLGFVNSASSAWRREVSKSNNSVDLAENGWCVEVDRQQYDLVDKNGEPFSITVALERQNRNYFGNTQLPDAVLEREFEDRIEEFSERYIQRYGNLGDLDGKTIVMTNLHGFEITSDPSATQTYVQSRYANNLDAYGYNPYTTGILTRFYNRNLRSRLNMAPGDSVKDADEHMMTTSIASIMIMLARRQEDTNKDAAWLLRRDQYYDDMYLTLVPRISGIIGNFKNATKFVSLH
jgi:hypothetical protein